ncbi:leucine-rich repeat and WD repeat-containing protein 1 [Anguilla anguilla]|uniref:leucine-rich repeat and WD repeat-containing protein 1 n=1 Tax=Anguilla anguilla TaxID=7936 RepID=UPI0015B1D083|nr:leucine-rich repeat and WD repeat-containing protein 1 [Anguilla anguilla]
MVKITESLLLEKGTPKSSKLEWIKTLNLSKLGLNSQDLPVSLLSQLSSLEELDLSGNHLQELPRGLSLPSLRVLDCSNNDMGDVTSLAPLTGLEELRLDDNLYLTVCDDYKVMFLLSNLRILNGRSISHVSKHLRSAGTAALQKRVITLWESTFSLPDHPTPEKLKTVEKEFVRVARSQIKYGPSSLIGYTKWRLEMIAKEHLHSLVEPGEEKADTKENSGQLSSGKRKSCEPDAVRENGSPCKRARGADPAPAPADASPRKSARHLSTPVKGEEHPGTPRRGLRESARHPSTPVKGEELPGTPRRGLRESARHPSTPVKGEELPGTPRRGRREPNSPAGKGPKAEGPRGILRDPPKDAPSPRKHPRTPSKATPQERMAERGIPQKMTSIESKDPVTLQPLHVLQCHSKLDSPDDFSTQLWACAFEPLQDSCDQTSGVVATCGGESVCVIDCETGHVLKKYKVPGEEFFTLAWSCVPMSREGGGVVRRLSVLAAGGKKGVVKLLHPAGNLAYGEFRASRRALSTLCFSPRQQSVLFTGSYDNRVVMWDIGGVDSDYTFKVSQLLVLETNSTPLHLGLPPSRQDMRHLLAACDKGLLCFSTQLGKDKLKRTEEMEITFPVYAKEEEEKDKHYRTIDGFAFLSDDIVASKSHMQGSIYLWSWGRTRVSRASGKQVSAVVLAELRWADTDTPYLSLSTCPGEGYVVCGDERGRLWTYHLTDLLKAGGKKGKVISPTEIVDWPSPVRKGVGPVEGPSINSVAMDPQLRYLVALSDKNMAVVWGRAQP